MSNQPVGLGIQFPLAGTEPSNEPEEHSSREDPQGPSSRLSAPFSSLTLDELEHEVDLQIEQGRHQGGQGSQLSISRYSRSISGQDSDPDRIERVVETRIERRTERERCERTQDTQRSRSSSEDEVYDEDEEDRALFELPADAVVRTNPRDVFQRIRDGDYSMPSTSRETGPQGVDQRSLTPLHIYRGRGRPETYRHVYHEPERTPGSGERSNGGAASEPTRIHLPLNSAIVPPRIGTDPQSSTPQSEDPKCPISPAKVKELVKKLSPRKAKSRESAERQRRGSIERLFRRRGSAS